MLAYVAGLSAAADWPLANVVGPVVSGSVVAAAGGAQPVTAAFSVARRASISGGILSWQWRMSFGESGGVASAHGAAIFGLHCVTLICWLAAIGGKRAYPCQSSMSCQRPLQRRSGSVVAFSVARR